MDDKQWATIEWGVSGVLSRGFDLKAPKEFPLRYCPFAQPLFFCRVFCRNFQLEFPGAVGGANCP